MKRTSVSIVGAARLIGQAERTCHRDRHQSGCVIGARSTYHDAVAEIID